MKLTTKVFDQLTTKHLYDSLKLRTDVFVVEQDCAYPEVDEIDLIAHHLLAYNESNLIGYLRIYTDERLITKIGRVVIDINHRKKGYARSLMNEALSFIENSSLNKRVELSAQTHLTDFYESLGFKQHGDAYLDYGIPHIDMVLN